MRPHEVALQSPLGSGVCARASTRGRNDAREAIAAVRYSTDQGLRRCASNRSPCVAVRSGPSEASRAGAAQVSPATRCALSSTSNGPVGGSKQVVRHRVEVAGSNRSSPSGAMIQRSPRHGLHQPARHAPSAWCNPVAAARRSESPVPGGFRSAAAAPRICAARSARASSADHVAPVGVLTRVVCRCGESRPAARTSGSNEVDAVFSSEGRSPRRVG